ncbi:hypothetical protein [Cupriavidus basilensis]|nr:hypothetical protein [Cupriavidus basilensis]
MWPALLKAGFVPLDWLADVSALVNIDPAPGTQELKIPADVLIG